MTRTRRGAHCFLLGGVEVIVRTLDYDPFFRERVRGGTVPGRVNRRYHRYRVTNFLRQLGRWQTATPEQPRLRRYTQTGRKTAQVAICVHWCIHAPQLPDTTSWVLNLSADVHYFATADAHGVHLEEQRSRSTPSRAGRRFSAQRVPLTCHYCGIAYLVGELL